MERSSEQQTVGLLVSSANITLAASRTVQWNNSALASQTVGGVGIYRLHIACPTGRVIIDSDRAIWATQSRFTATNHLSDPRSVSRQSADRDEMHISGGLDLRYVRGWGLLGRREWRRSKMMEHKFWIKEGWWAKIHKAQNKVRSVCLQIILAVNCVILFFKSRNLCFGTSAFC